MDDSTNIARQKNADLLRHGDKKAWEEVVLEYQAPLSRYLYNMMRDKELARDLTQDTFIEAYKGISKTKGELNFKAWLYRIATNNAIQVIRRRKIVSWISLTDEENKYREARNIEDDFIQREFVRVVLGKMPEKYRAILLLHDHQGFNCSEISNMLNISVDAAKKRLARGRCIFRDSYEQLEEGSIK